MAKAIKVKGPSKELQLFSQDLYDFIWEKYMLNSRSLERAFKVNLKREARDESEIIKHFNVDIGKAVLCTQCLLREFCNFYLIDLDPVTLNKEEIYEMARIIIYNFTEIRNDVFIEVFDIAAIVAETYLYCFEVLKKELDLTYAPEMFITFFNQKKLRKEYFQSGGWIELRERTFDDFVYLNLNLVRFVCFEKLKYQRLEYNCELIKMIRDCAIVFPVEASKLCSNCFTTAPRFLRATFGCETTVVKENSRIEASNDVTSQQKYSLKLDPPQQEKSPKRDPPQEEELNLSMSKCGITEETKHDEKKIIRTFNCLFWGNSESIKGVKTENRTVYFEYYDAEILPKKKKKKKRKSKAKPDCEAEVKTDTCQTTCLEASCSQDIEESCEE